MIGERDENDEKGKKNGSVMPWAVNAAAELSREMLMGTKGWDAHLDGEMTNCQQQETCSCSIAF